jgi:tetratricopeptide (TPR) repeat protein
MSVGPLSDRHELAYGTTGLLGVPVERLVKFMETANGEPERWSHEDQSLVEVLETNFGLSRTALKAIFRTLHGSGMPVDRLESALISIVQRQKDLRQRLQTPIGSDAKVEQYRRTAGMAVDLGNYERADQLIAEAETRNSRGIFERPNPFDHARKSIAELNSDRGVLCLVQLEYERAANYFLAACDCLPASNDVSRVIYLTQSADALSIYGAEACDNAALIKAADIYTDVLSRLAPERTPIRWAAIQCDLGDVLSTLGRQEGRADRFEAAVEAFRKALAQYSSDTAATRRAEIQTKIGTALMGIADHQAGTGTLEHAARNFREALEIFALESASPRWAEVQTSLGSCLMRLGERETETGSFEQAVQAYTQALTEYAPERTPLLWASAQNDLGTAIASLGDRANDAGRLEEAVLIFTEVLNFMERDRIAQSWASVQNNLATALASLGELEGSQDRLNEAVRAFREVATVYNREETPLLWAGTQINLANALQSMSERGGGVDRLLEAVAITRDALEIFEELHCADDVAFAKECLAVSEALLADREGGHVQIDRLNQL